MRASTASPTSAEPPAAWDSQAARAQIRTWAIAIGFAVAARATIAESRWIPSPSMVPALAIGDRLIVDKLTPHFRVPHRGEIIVFRPVWFHETPTLLQRLSMADDGALIKRVVGLPGETVAIRAGKVWINGKPLAEPYAAGPTRPEMAPTVIPANSLFVMGDNRGQSADSRVFGAMPLDHLVGRAIWRFWPIGRIGNV